MMRTMSDSRRLTTTSGTMAVISVTGITTITITVPAGPGGRD
jgi:hypothetical protein